MFNNYNIVILKRLRKQITYIKFCNQTIIFWLCIYLFLCGKLSDLHIVSYSIMVNPHVVLNLSAMGTKYQHFFYILTIIFLIIILTCFLI